MNEQAKKNINTIATYLCDSLGKKQQQQQNKLLDQKSSNWCFLFDPRVNFHTENCTIIPTEQQQLLLSTDIIVLCGSSCLDTVSACSNAFWLLQKEEQKKDVCIVVTGGIGHSTKFLYEEIQKEEEKYSKVFSFGTSDSTTTPTTKILENLSEAEIFSQLLQKIYQIPSKNIIVEKESTNCGDNAKLSVPLILHCLLSNNSSSSSSSSSSSLMNSGTQQKEEEEENKKFNILLVQDPTMQRRSRLSFKKYFASSSSSADFRIISACVPFGFSSCSVEEESQQRKQKQHLFRRNEAPYSISRYSSLLLGEIPRLRNDENGYSTNGKNYIAEDSDGDIPECVEVAFKELCSSDSYSGNSDRKI